MKTFPICLVITFLASMMALHSEALLMRNNVFTNPQAAYNVNTVLVAKNSSFEQLPGESDIDFIHRVTSQSKALIEEQSSSSASASAPNEEEEANKKPKGTYQRIEEWDEERKTKGELTWEEKVMFEGQKHGNQVRQNDILLRNLHSF